MFLIYNLNYYTVLFCHTLTISYYSNVKFLFVLTHMEQSCKRAEILGPNAKM